MGEVQSYTVDDRDQSVEVEEYEEFLSVKTYTVIYPWTMVIHKSYASSTVIAVMNLWWLNWIAFVAFLFYDLVNVCISLHSKCGRMLLTYGRERSALIKHSFGKEMIFISYSKFIDKEIDITFSVSFKWRFTYLLTLESAILIKLSILITSLNITWKLWVRSKLIHYAYLFEMFLRATKYFFWHLPTCYLLSFFLIFPISLQFSD